MNIIKHTSAALAGIVVGIVAAVVFTIVAQGLPIYSEWVAWFFIISLNIITVSATGAIWYACANEDTWRVGIGFTVVFVALGMAASILNDITQMSLLVATSFAMAGVWYSHRYAKQ